MYFSDCCKLYFIHGANLSRPERPWQCRPVEIKILSEERESSARQAEGGGDEVIISARSGGKGGSDKLRHISNISLDFILFSW